MVPHIKLHTSATEDDMVRVCVLNGDKWVRKSEAWAEVSKDDAFSQAFASNSFEWPNSQVSLQDLEREPEWDFGCP